MKEEKKFKNTKKIINEELLKIIYAFVSLFRDTAGFKLSDNFFPTIMEKLLDIFPGGAGLIYYLDKKSKYLKLLSYHGLPPKLVKYYKKIEKPNKLVEIISDKKNVVIFNGEAKELVPLEKYFKVKFYMGIPLLSGKKLVGVMGISCPDNYYLSNESIEIFYRLGRILGEIIDKYCFKDRLNSIQTYFEEIINSIQHVGICCSPDRYDKLVLYNNAAARIFGWSYEDAIGKKAPIDFFKPEDREPLYSNILRRVKEFDEIFEGEVELVRKGGNVFPAFLYTAPIKDSKGNYLGLIGVIQDLSEKGASSKIIKNKWDKDESVKFVDPLMGKSKKIRTLCNYIHKVARTNFTVLIQGESGSGKSFVAKIIHNYSLGNKGPFVSVDCGAIPETLIESELFGYEKGSFTGAGQQKKGYFESANGGTIFLDDIENLPFHLQSKLLKIVHDKRMQRIGSTKSIPLDVRLIAAANIPLEKLIKSGKFRSDLYFRLNEFGLFIPPLRERKEDIMYLATIFLNMASRELGKKISGFSPEAEAVIKSHYWPGNVRELKNIVRRAALMCEDEILPEYLILDKFDSENKESLPDVKFDGNISETKSLKDIFSELERDIILKTLQKTKWNRKKAAEILKIDYKTIIYKIKNYNL